MKLAKEGYRYILAFLVLGAALGFIHTGLGVVMGVLAGFVAFFFRDPQRKVPLSDDHVLSPADGTITGVRTLQKDPYLDEPYQCISIFLSILDVHVNRSPVSGRVKRQTYYPGKFLMAFAKEAAVQNESNLLVIETKRGDVMVRQIAGKIARRIVCDVREVWDHPVWIRSGTLSASGL
jgi:phosphatidylserine decarboxylase